MSDSKKLNFWFIVWFDNLDNLGMMVFYIEWYFNFGIICEEL